MATATAMYHTGRNPLKRQTYKKSAEKVETVKGEKQRRLHKAFLRWHDPENWPLLREALKTMGRADLIGEGPKCLIPSKQPESEAYQSPRRKNSVAGKGVKRGRVLTQHTGLPPRAGNKSQHSKSRNTKTRQR
jgi:hypothetical protein